MMLKATHSTKLMECNKALVIGVGRVSHMFSRFHQYTCPQSGKDLKLALGDLSFMKPCPEILFSRKYYSCSDEYWNTADQVGEQSASSGGL